MKESGRSMYAPNLISVGIDRYGKSGYSGRIWHQYGDEPVRFTDMMDMLRQMEMLYDTWNFPQSSTDSRSFVEKKNPVIQNPLRKAGAQMDVQRVQGRRGDKGTFLVCVRYRQNSTWQGHVVWAEKNQQQSFRSALELLKLIDSALDIKEDENTQVCENEEGGWDKQ